MYPNDAFELNLSKNLSNYSTLHPPKPFSVTLPSFQSLSPPSLSSAASVCSSTPATSPPQPPAAANDLQEVRLAWQRAGSRSLLQERGMHGHRHCSRDGGVRLFALLLSVGPHLLDFSACFPFTLAM